MHCREARERLNRYQWRLSEYRRDRELVEHLKTCPRCGRLAQTEESLEVDFELLRRSEPPTELNFNALKEKVETSGAEAHQTNAGSRFSFYTAKIFKTRRRFKIAFGFVGVIIVFMSLVPFNFTETVGYEVAISGIDRNIALDNREIKSLLNALGMDRDKAAGILDSLDRKEIHLYVGECRETCHLKISDLKSERDVRIVVKAIVDLGCCEIDKIIPIFRNESTSLIGHATRKLFS
ncbi:MAG: hypothetical protein JXA92_03945 [candidate division Zixibacteria bacterium]|nr:hypothetical protein [candidate division Zixibacteria bacterium]